MFLFLAGSAWKSSDAKRQWGQDLLWAIRRAKTQQKAVAATLDMDEGQFSREASDGKLPGGNVAEVPDVEIEHLKIRAERHGLMVFDKSLGCLLNGMDELLGRRRMAKMEQDEQQKKEGAA